MLAVPKRAVSGPNEPPRSDRVISDNWRGLYGSAPFSSMLRGAASGVLRNGAIYANISGFEVFFSPRIVVRRGAHLILNRQILSKTLAIRNLTGSGARRILKPERDQQKCVPVLPPIAL
jgi:hypothetical protein